MRPKIIAVDFDGTLIEEGHFPNTGPPNEQVLNYCKSEQSKGARIILWTNREGDPLDTAVQWCKDHGLYLDAINDNLPESIAFLGCNSRKIYADEFIDDRAVRTFNLPYRHRNATRIKQSTPEELIEAYKTLYFDRSDPIICCQPHNIIPNAIFVEHYSGLTRDFYIVEDIDDS